MTTEHFSSSILKTNKKGQVVLSTYLEDGEKLYVTDPSQPVLPPLQSGEGQAVTTMTLDETKTSTFSGTIENPDASVERKTESAQQSENEADANKTADERTSEEAAKTSDDEPQQPTGADKREWYAYAQAVDPEFTSEYEEVTQKQLAEKYGK